MRFGPLTLTARRSGTDPEPTPSGVRLQGEASWMLEGPAEALVAVADALPPRMTERIGSVLLLDFGNAVGRFVVPGLGTLEVVSGKHTEADFEALLADLTARVAALPFAAGDAARLPYDRSLTEHRPVLYQTFVYLRSLLSDLAPQGDRLAPALEAVVRDPHFRLEHTVRTRPLALASRTDGSYLVRLAAGAEPLERAPAGLRAAPLATALRGHLPLAVRETHPARTYDTAENRFAKFFIDLCTSIIDRMDAIARAATRAARFWRRVQDDCARMRRALRPYATAPLWSEVGRMTHLPAGSTVLQRRRGYRQLYAAYLRLRASARLPLDRAGLEDLLEIKDIALLYELWCYFRVVDAVTEALGRKPTRVEPMNITDTAVHVPFDFQVEWPGAIRCYYNLRHSRSAPAHRRSYSVPLRPDIVLHIPRPDGHLERHAFDAKFRLQWLDRWDTEEPPTEDRRSTFKRADLYKMHTYRDALGMDSVWVLYPGERWQAFEVDGRVAVGACPVGVGGVHRLAKMIARLLADEGRLAFAASENLTHV